MSVPTLAPVDSPLNMGVSSLAVLPLTQVSTVKPRDLLTTFSPCITSISYFLLQRQGNKGGGRGEGVCEHGGWVQHRLGRRGKVD